MGARRGHKFILQMLELCNVLRASPHSRDVAPAPNQGLTRPLDPGLFREPPFSHLPSPALAWLLSKYKVDKPHQAQMLSKRSFSLAAYPLSQANSATQVGISHDRNDQYTGARVLNHWSSFSHRHHQYSA